ncbi:MAG: nucleotidyltransferase domain-containing protein [Acidobacteria bacterium]|jgi:predicted nucleotidyltransferase|nr:nucleotidyltransferase domain-containing protein [Acidobacteriota bacterium]
MAEKKISANMKAHQMPGRIPKKVQKILKEIQEELQMIYFDKLKEIILFGSYARGDYAEGSDIDIALLLEGLKDSYMEREKYFPAVCRISLQYDTVVSVVPFDYREFQVKKTPLILNVQKEGVRL